jgi:hypothetical protein
VITMLRACEILGHGPKWVEVPIPGALCQCAERRVLSPESPAYKADWHRELGFGKGSSIPRATLKI